jgi:hypothetical protein
MGRRWRRAGYIAGALDAALVTALLVAVALAAVVLFAEPVPCHRPDEPAHVLVT